MKSSLINFHKNTTLLYVFLTTRKPPHNRHFSAVSSAESWLAVQGNPLIKWPHNPNLAPSPSADQQNSSPTSNSNPNYHQNDFFTLCNILKDPKIQLGPSLRTALDRTGIEPELGLIQSVFDHFDSSPKLLHSVFLWAEKKPGFQSSAALFNSMVNFLGKQENLVLLGVYCLIGLVEMKEGIWFLVTLLPF